MKETYCFRLPKKTTKMDTKNTQLFKNQSVNTKECNILINSILKIKEEKKLKDIYVQTGEDEFYSEIGISLDGVVFFWFELNFDCDYYMFNHRYNTGNGSKIKSINQMMKIKTILGLYDHVIN